MSGACILIIIMLITIMLDQHEVIKEQRKKICYLKTLVEKEKQLKF